MIESDNDLPTYVKDAENSTKWTVWTKPIEFQNNLYDCQQLTSTTSPMVEVIKSAEQFLKRTSKSTSNKAYGDQC